MTGLKSSITVSKDYNNHDITKVVIEVESEPSYSDGFAWALRILNAVMESIK